MLDTSRNLLGIPILTCARRLKRRAQVKIDGLGAFRGLACERYSPTRRTRGGQERCVEQRAQGRLSNSLSRFISTDLLSNLIFLDRPDCSKSRPSSSAPTLAVLPKSAFVMPAPIHAARAFSFLTGTAVWQVPTRATCWQLDRVRNHLYGIPRTIGGPASLVNHTGNRCHNWTNRFLPSASGRISLGSPRRT